MLAADRVHGIRLASARYEQRGLKPRGTQVGG